MTTITMDANEQRLVETCDRARALLEGLMEAKRKSEANLAALAKPDYLKKVTGRSSIENAIASTKQMIETLERSIAAIRAQIQGDLSGGASLA